MNEHAVLLDANASRVGVLTEPPLASRSGQPAVIFLNAGLVHRVGPNRMYVRIARRLAGQGFVSLRFDFSGVGDSALPPDGFVSDQNAVVETLQAMDFLAERRCCDRFVLVGLCSGALTALRTAARDVRVVGAALINTRGGSQQFRDYIRGQAAAHKCGELLRAEPRTWITALRGKASGRSFYTVLAALARDAARRLGDNRRLRSEASELANEWAAAMDRGVRLLLVYSAGDPGLAFLETTLHHQVQRLHAEGRLQFHVVPAADHTFTPTLAREELFARLEEWFAAFPTAAVRGGSDGR